MNQPNYAEFVALVEDMRNRQREHHRVPARATAAVVASAERRVDEAVKAYRSAQKQIVFGGEQP